MNSYHICSDRTSLGLKAKSVCFSKSPLRFPPHTVEGDARAVHHGPEPQEKQLQAPDQNTHGTKDDPPADRRSFSSPSKLYTSQVWLRTFPASSVKGFQCPMNQRSQQPPGGSENHKEDGLNHVAHSLRLSHPRQQHR